MRDDIQMTTGERIEQLKQCRDGMVQMRDAMAAIIAMDADEEWKKEQIRHIFMVGSLLIPPLPPSPSTDPEASVLPPP